MTFDVKITEQAEKDLRGIYEYIAFELLAPENASGQLERLEDAINSLDHMPERFRKYEREPWRSRGLRVMPVNNYLVLYAPKNEENVVNIIRVMYAGRNVDKELNRHTGK